MTFRAKAWLAWTGAALVTVIAIDDPVASLIACASIALTGVVFAARGPEGRAAVLLVKVGMVFLVLRVVMFALTGHTGATTIVTLPQVSMPWWLGSFSLGGRVTAEVVAQATAEGIRVMAMLACGGVFLAVVPTERVLRLLPRFLFEVALVIGIAIAFVPSMIRRAAEVRDAQRLRGVRLRGPRALRAFFVPVVAGALEGSLALAASMEARGFGRSRHDDHRAEVRARVALLAGLLALVAGGGTLLFRRAFWAWPLAVAGALAIAWSLRALGRGVQRTRYRNEPPDAWDRAMIAASVIAAVLAFASRALPGAHWYPYPVLRAPAMDARVLAIALLPAAPVLIAWLRTVRLARASALNDAVEPRALEAVR